MVDVRWLLIADCSLLLVACCLLFVVIGSSVGCLNVGCCLLFGCLPVC